MIGAWACFKVTTWDSASRTVRWSGKTGGGWLERRGWMVDAQSIPARSGIARSGLSLWGKLQPTHASRAGFCSRQLRRVNSPRRREQKPRVRGAGWRRGRDCRASVRGEASSEGGACAWLFVHMRSREQARFAPVNEQAPLARGLHLAEREGFEPPLPLRVKRFSRPPHSTALPPLRNGGAKVTRSFGGPPMVRQARRSLTPWATCVWSSSVPVPARACP